MYKIYLSYIIVVLFFGTRQKWKENVRYILRLKVMGGGEFLSRCWHHAVDDVDEIISKKERISNTLGVGVELYLEKLVDAKVGTKIHISLFLEGNEYSAH